MMLARAPGPLIMGMASGNTLMSLRVRDSASSSLVSRSRWANTMSTAMRNSSRPPATRKASRLMPSRPSSQAPPTAKKSSRPPATSTARSATRRRSSRDRSPPSARNTGTRPTGSMTTSSVRNDFSARAASVATAPSGDEEDLAGGLAAFEGPVGLACLGQRERGSDAQAQLAGGDGQEHVGGPRAQALLVRDVVEEARPREEEGALRREQAGIEGGEGAAGLAEEHQHAPGREHRQAALEGVPAHGIVHHVHAAALRDALRLGLEVGFVVADHLVGPRLAGEHRLLVGGDGGQHPRPAPLGHLHEQQA